MAQETVDAAVKLFGFNIGGCITEKVRLVGSDGWSTNMFIGLIQRVSRDNAQTDKCLNLGEFAAAVWTRDGSRKTYGRQLR